MSIQTAGAQATGTLTITVDGRRIEARPGEMIIAAAERGGVYIPRFCWHPRMKPVGMCRMCLVELVGPRGPSLQPSCYVPVADGQEVVTTSDRVKKAQDGVLEFLLINHPLDCPVCDRGGECPLQDQTFAFGPGETRFIEEKRHWPKPIPINPLVALDRERCIQCARCTRFAEEVAGDALIDFVGRSDATEVGIFEDEPFTSNFSGNVVQICPVGALTATPYRFKARPWDLEVVESTCTACAVGCRVAVQSSADRLIRTLGVDSDPVNHGWLCDKGRFGYQAVDNPARLVRPRVRGAGGELVDASWPEALQAAADGLRRVIDAYGPSAVAVLGGARLANEDAYAWSKLARAVLGTDNVDCQLADGLPAEVVLGLPRATIDEACRAPAVLVLAPDLKEELPVLYLRLREAAVEGWSRVVEVVPQPTALSAHAAATLVYRPGEAATVARAIARHLDGSGTGRVDSRVARAADALAAAGGQAAGGQAAGDQAAGDQAAGGHVAGGHVAGGHVAGGHVVVVLGRPSLAEGADSVAEAASILAEALPGARFLTVLRRGNVFGALDAGLAPGVLPGRVSLEDGRAWFEAAWSAPLPSAPGLDALEIMAEAAAGGVRALVLVGADPAADFPDRELARRALAAVELTVAVDLYPTASHDRADVVLAASGWGERAGTTTNLEGRVTRLGQKVTPPGVTRPDWMIAADLARHLGADLGFETIDDIAAEIERLSPVHAGLTPGLLARYPDGLVVPLTPDELPAVGLPAPHANASAGEAVEAAAAAAQGGTLLAEPEPEGGSVALGPVPASGVPASGGPGGPSAVAARPPLLGPVSVRGRPAPPVDAYSLRLVSARLLYDAGVLVAQSPALAPLVPGAHLRANPADLDDLGIVTGDPVRVTSSRASLVVPAQADGRVPRGSAALAFNQPGEGAADLIDATQPVTDVRLESVS